jgi:hypothetical protein
MLLGGGAVLAGLLLGAITAFLIDRKFFWAAGYSLGGAVLGFIGLVHWSKVGWDIGGQIALGYLFAAVVLAAFGLWQSRVAKADVAPADAAGATTEALREAAETSAGATEDAAVLAVADAPAASTAAGATVAVAASTEPGA